MKSIVFKISSILAMVLFCMMPMANAGTGGSGGGNTGGGTIGLCGYESYTQPCSPGSTDERIKCRTVQIGGEDSCTLENCDGTTIELSGRPGDC